MDVLIVAVPETAGSALYGMVDVLLATGNIWQNLVRSEPPRALFRVRIASPLGEAFRCGNGIPVTTGACFNRYSGPRILRRFLSHDIPS
ncbi:MAG: hypothetical protein U9R74_06440 [Pseudomonadota bacterium]|nr:hypothetical protein [Pseudomonadota bacterium]